jgi:hypothetical protein
VATIGDLERAIRTEANAAVCHWWGVTPQTVSKWRRVLGVGPVNPGTSQLRRERLLPRVHEMVALIDHSDPVRNAKIAEAHRGKARPLRDKLPMWQAARGRPLSAEHWAKISAANRRNGNRPPKDGRAWTPAEDRLLRRLPAAEVAKRTGRTLGAVYLRRHKLGLPDGRRR